MNRIYRKNPFWSLAGPLLGYVAIQWIVQFAAEMVISIPYMFRTYSEILGKQQPISVQEMTEIYMEGLEPALELVLKYQVEISGLAAACTIIMSLILFRKDRGLEKKAGLAPKRAAASGYLPVILFGLAGCVAYSCFAAMVQMAFYDAEYAETAETLYSAGFPMQVLILGLIIPLAEELMFRGILFRRYRENRTFAYAAFASALFFSFMHTNMTQMIYAFFLGILLAYVYDRYGSFLAPLALHMILNTGSLVFTEIGLFAWIGRAPVRMAAAVIIGTFLCSVSFVMIQKIKDVGYDMKAGGNQSGDINSIK